MLDRLHDYSECFVEPDRWAIATIVEVSGSVPRPVGTSMAVRDDGRTIGSVSGGCVEGAVVAAALDCLESGTVELHSFGYADDDGIAVGLMCGGDVRMLVQPVSTIDPAARVALAAGKRSNLVREVPLVESSRNGGIVSGGYLPFGRSSAGEPSSRAGDLLLNEPGVQAALTAGGAHLVDVTDRTLPECPVVRRVFVESTARPARVIIYGANDFAASLAQAAAALGRHVTVCDARPAFATAARHPGAHEVVLARPGEHFAAELASGRIDARTAIIVLTHDPRFDLPVLQQALRSGVGYVGAMGSRVTHEKRMQELRASGIPDDLLARLHSPIGLDIGARTPAEVAVSILAEVILAETTTRTGILKTPPRRLRETDGDVHDGRRVCASTASTEEVPAWM